MKRLLILALLLSLFIAACAPEPTPEPSPTPTEEVVAEDPTPTAEVIEEADAGAEATAEGEAEGETQRLVLATTTSTEDSGLLDFIIPDFEEQYNAEVDVIAVGTGQALELGSNGDADVVLVHARAREDAFVEAGDGTARFDVMFNDFVIVGPDADPAGIRGVEDAETAFQQIAESEATFISRGDDSGTHSKELAIWSAAGIEPEGNWYQSAGQGMGAVLGIADEQQGYTLTDRATFVARLAEGLELVILVEGDEILLNPYGVIPVNPEKHPTINADLAQDFVEWLTSVDTQMLIASFEVSGEQLFFPDSEAYRASESGG